VAVGCAPSCSSHRSLAFVGFAAGVGAARAVEEVAPVKVGLKWPNDLMIGERKLGGV